MIDRVGMTEPTAPAEGGVRDAAREGEAAAGPSTLTILEERVRRLEDAVAGMQDTRHLEERVVERLADRNRADPAQDATGIVTEAGRLLLPAATPAEPPADGASVPPPVATPVRPAPRAGHRPWLLFDLYASVRAAMYMYVDPRYRMTWTGRFLPWILVGAILFSWFWIPFLSLIYYIPLGLGPILAWVIMKFVDLFLAFVLFKVLSREATRYRETAPDLPPSLRL